jgi:hypothetical protein
MPIAAERTTVATEISRLFVNASRLDGVSKKCRYVSSDSDPPGKKLSMNVNAFGYRTPMMSTTSTMMAIMTLGGRDSDRKEMKSKPNRPV